MCTDIACAAAPCIRPPGARNAAICTFTTDCYGRCRPFNVLDVRASVNQSVFDFSSIRRFQSAKVSTSAAKSEVNNTRDQVMDQVAGAYLAGLRAQTSIETAKANVELSEALVKLAESQKNAGTGTGIEVTRANVQLANDRQNLLVAQTQQTRANLQLLKVLGVRLDNPVELTDRMDYVPVDLVDATQALTTALNWVSASCQCR